VVPKAARVGMVDASIKSSDLWQHFAVYQLTQPIRTGSDPAYTAFITAVGDGTAPYVDEKTGRSLPNQAALQAAGGPHWIEIPPPLLHSDTNPGIKIVFEPSQLRNNVHPRAELQRNEHADAASTRAVITPHNDTAAAHNANFLAELCNPLHTLFACNTLPDDAIASGSVEPAFMSHEFMKRLHQPGVPSHCLYLKIGALVMLMRNLSPECRALNGVRFRVVRISRTLISVCHIDVDHPQAGDLLHIPRIAFEIAIPKSALKVTRLQFPLQLAYALTANKGVSCVRALYTYALTANKGVSCVRALYTAVLLYSSVLMSCPARTRPFTATAKRVRPVVTLRARVLTLPRARNAPLQQARENPSTVGVESTARGASLHTVSCTSPYHGFPRQTR
jgi:PIF1-like helicase